MNDYKNLRFECIRCGNCCTDKNTLVSLTYLDILRIKNGLDLDINDVLETIGFFVFDKALTEEDKQRMVLSPIITEKGLAFIALLKNSLGGCFFYNSTDNKCLIYDIRPMFCQTFPFSFRLIENDEKEAKIDIFYTEKGKEYCPGIGKEAALIDQHHWIKLSKKALEDLKKNYNVITEWNKSVKNGKITPSVKKFFLNIFKLKDLIKPS